MPSDMTINLFLLVLFILAALWSVVTIRLLRAAIGLALVSAILALLMYRLGAALSAVFELSVCAGLISVIFISAISLTQRLTSDKLEGREKERLRVFWVLPVIVLITGILLYQVILHFEHPQITPVQISPLVDVRTVLWSQRPLDLIGQISILLAGAIGVALLFKERHNG